MIQISDEENKTDDVDNVYFTLLARKIKEFKEVYHNTADFENFYIETLYLFDLIDNHKQSWLKIKYKSLKHKEFIRELNLLTCDFISYLSFIMSGRNEELGHSVPNLRTQSFIETIILALSSISNHLIAAIAKPTEKELENIKRDVYLENVKTRIKAGADLPDDL